MIFDLELIQQEFKSYGFIDTFEKLRLKLLVTCEFESEKYINFYKLSEALNILNRGNYDDFSFEEMVAAIEQAEIDEMDYEVFKMKSCG
jgi:hypothetical protein